jgi:hypothetical protein
MKLTPNVVEEYLAAAQGGRVYAMKLARNAGYRFATTSFLRMADELAEYRSLGLVEPWNEEPAVDILSEPDEDEEDEPILEGTMYTPDQRRETGVAHTYVFTSAQNNTRVIPGFQALVRYCEARDAELHISRFTYNKSAYGKNSVKPGSKKVTDGDDLWYAPEIAPYVSDDAIQIADDLVWCGELNILPTRINPLSGRVQGYTRHASAIVPHTTMALQSVPTMKSAPAKFLYSTGCITQLNYIQKLTGQVAEFHHVFGALVVEVDERGNWWARQLNFDRDGGFYDLDSYWTADGCEPVRHRVQAITHGDIHWSKVDRAVLETVFAPGGVVDQLVPEEQFFHDTIDFTARNHHNIKDPHFLHEMYVKRTDSVQEEFSEVAEFLATMADRPWLRNFIIVSNHDQAIEQWLRNSAAMYDPVNARFWHEMNADCYIKREHNKKPRPFTTALKAHLPEEFLQRCTIVQEDDSYRILGQIEAGLHGHLGPNGARGNPKNLRTVGKANTAHTHSAGIVDGVYTAGVYGKLDMGYNKGLSSWSHSFILTYPNAKRAILTIKEGRAWRDQ